MRTKIAQFFFVLLIAITQNVMANDSIGYLGAGGIVFKKSEDISMEKETLTVSRHLVRVEYEFFNKTDKSIKETITFPMPFYGFDYGCESKHSGPLQQFKVWVDGVKVDTSRTVRARLSDGRDVTDNLRKLGFTDDDIAGFHGAEMDCGDFKMSSKYAKQIDLLKKAGLVDVSQDQAPTPLWEASYVYYWKQEFPQTAKVHVVHEYKPFAGSGSGDINFNDPTTIHASPYELADFCVNKELIESAKKYQKRMQKKHQFETHYWHEVIDYVLTTGANWSGPIKDFTLNLKKGTEDDIVSICFDGDFKKKDDLTLTTNIKNFLPRNDLKVLFYYPSEYGVHNKSPNQHY